MGALATTSLRGISTWEVGASQTPLSPLLQPFAAYIPPPEGDREERTIKQQSGVPLPPLLPPCSNRNTSLRLQHQKRDQSNRIKHEKLLVAAFLFLNEAAWQLPSQRTLNMSDVKLWSWVMAE